MLYRFNIELSDVDRGVYESLDFRVAQHPSETAPYLLSRVLAFALCVEEGLEFSAAGLHDPEAPALQAMSAHGTIEHWIEIGNPSAKKLHKATKTAKKVSVFTYKSPEVLVQDIQNNGVHKASEIQIYAFDPKFLTALHPEMQKNNRWSILHQQGHLDIDTGGKTFSTDLRKIN